MVCFVVVSGLPGSGKTTLARALARELDVALLSKDVIKEALFDSLGTRDVEWSKQLERASMHVLFALARDVPGAVLESFWDRDLALEALGALTRPAIEVFCDCSTRLAQERYRRRSRAERHAGHLDDQREREFDAWVAAGRGEPLGLGGPLLRVVTDGPVDVAAVAAWIREQRVWEPEPVWLRPTAELAAVAEAVVAEVEASLRELLPGSQIEHTGATSLPDGVTKGDVDLNIRVPAAGFADAVEVLREWFSVSQPENWTTTFASFSDAAHALPVGLQVTVIGSPDDFLVPLRDLMRTDTRLRQEYERCKRSAAGRGPSGYWAAKNALLTDVLDRHFPGVRRPR
jgi:predicted kinase/GrpB-like predicted nucleotidyltransferase (UPF0157 family)